jgi:hypothetical protein
VRGFTDPVFLVPSPYFHKHALHGIDEHGIKLQFHASMEQGSKDVWSRWALRQADLGLRILQLRNGLPAPAHIDPKAEQLIAMSGALWVRRPPSIVVPKSHRAA